MGWARCGASHEGSGVTLLTVICRPPDFSLALLAWSDRTRGGPSGDIVSLHGTRYQTDSNYRPQLFTEDPTLLRDRISSLSSTEYYSRDWAWG